MTRARPRLLLALAAVLALTLTACAHSTGSSPAASPTTTGSSSTSSGSAQPPSDPLAQKRNVVFVLTDDLAMNLVQYMPHVLALEKSGTTFSNYNVADSLCCPSRSSIFSGKFPHDTGVFTNSGTDGGFHVFHGRGEESATFATALQSAGYRTAMMGKYLNGYMPGAKLGGTTPYVPPGWNEWDVAGSGYGEFNYNLNENGKVVHYGKTPADYLTTVVGGKGASFISSSAAAKKPFLLEIATFTPHAPYVPAPQDANAFPTVKAPQTPAYDVLPTDAPAWLAQRQPLTAQEKTAIDVAFRKRVQDVQSVDRMIAGLEATLTKAGVAGNTDIVFSSDNGYHMGEYRLNPGKMTAFDTDIHVPLVISGPGVAAGRVAPQIVQNIDLAPTFEALGHAATPVDVDGRSLAPLLAGQSPTDWRTVGLVEHHGPDHDATDPDMPPKNSGNPPTYDALRTATYTYVQYADGATEYYDRQTDPDELHNIVQTLPAATLATLHTEVTALSTCHGGTACWTAAHGT